MIRSIWRILQNHEDCEDALQNALLQIWKRWPRITEHPSPAALVLKICNDCACDLYRRKTAGKRLEEESSSEPVSQQLRPDLEIEGRENCALISWEIQKLPEQQRNAILLRASGCSDAEIALVLGCSEPTVRKHVSLGRNTLAIALAGFAGSTTTRSQK